MSSGKGQEKAADTSAANATALSNQYNTQQQQMYKLLFGGGGSGGGALGGFTNPASLNVTSPTGVYKTQMNNANNAAASQYANNNAAIKTNAAEMGFGSNAPAGFTAQQENQNANALANTKGQNFQTATTQQYQDALKNFWNSIGTASNAMGQGEQGALGGNQQAASTYANLYGNAGKNGAWSNPILGDYVKGAMAAAGGLAGS